MTETQKIVAALVRLPALYLVFHGALGLLGFAIFERIMGPAGLARMAVGSALMFMLLGAVLFVGAKAVARLVTFDMD